MSLVQKERLCLHSPGSIQHPADTDTQATNLSVKMRCCRTNQPPSLTGPRKRRGGRDQLAHHCCHLRSVSSVFHSVRTPSLATCAKNSIQNYFYLYLCLKRRNCCQECHRKKNTWRELAFAFSYISVCPGNNTRGKRGLTDPRTQPPSSLRGGWCQGRVRPATQGRCRCPYLMSEPKEQPRGWGLITKRRGHLQQVLEQAPL